MRLRKAGVFNFFETVFRDQKTAGTDDLPAYAPDLRAVYDSKKRKKTFDELGDAKQQTYYRTYWRTHQMSDHLPMWVELKVDFGREYLVGRSKKPK